MSFVDVIRHLLLNPRDLFYYFQGKYRYWLLEKTKYGKYFIGERTRYVIFLRYKLAKKECLDNAACVVCGCDMPELLYCDKGCEGKCYPHRKDNAGLIKRLDEYALEILKKKKDKIKSNGMEK